MARMVDDMLGGKIEPMPWAIGEISVADRAKSTAYTRSVLRDAEVFVIDNVSDYLYTGTDQEMWDVTKDFPCLAPPFPTFWMETTRPAEIKSREHGIVSSRHLPWRWGFVCCAVELTGRTQPEGARWGLGAVLFVQQRKGTVMGPAGEWRLLLDEAGQVVDQFWGLTVTPNSKHAADSDRAAALSTLFYPACLAISFLHCKNVTIEDNEPPTRVSKKREKRRGEPLQTYHTLYIQPMREILRREGQIETQGLQRALHICRGHFKDYRQSGLFGRHHGIYWWDSFVRGSAEVGTSEKRYSVSAPKESSAG